MLEHILKPFFYIISLINQVIHYITHAIAHFYALCYDIVFATPITFWSYRVFAREIKKNFNNTHTLLDIGIATGRPLKSVLKILPQDMKIVGIDINKSYLKAAAKTFANCPNVEVREQNFYDLGKNTKEKYDVILFSFSYMLMPSQIQALRKAKQHLNKNGRVYFIQTVHDRQYAIVEWAKPYLKYLLTVDFGKITVYTKFLEQLKVEGFKVEKDLRIKKWYNPVLNIFKIHLFECSV